MKITNKNTCFHLSVNNKCLYCLVGEEHKCDIEYCRRVLTKYQFPPSIEGKIKYLFRCYSLNNDTIKYVHILIAIKDSCPEYLEFAQNLLILDE